MIIDKTHSVAYDIDRPSNLFTKENLKDKFEDSEDQYYIKHARWIASRYNLERSTRYSHKESKSGLQQSNERSTVDQILSNYAYVLGEQENMTYAYLTQDSEGGELQAPFTKGEQIYRLVEFMKGGLRTLLNNAKVSVESLDPSKQSKKMERVQNIEMKKKLLPLFEQMEAETGLGYYPEGMGQTDLDSALEELSMSPSDKLEMYGLDILTDTVNRNRLQDQMLRAAADAIIGRHASMYAEVNMGRVITQVIPPYTRILDDSTDDDFRSKDEYTGFIEQLTPEEITAKWNLTPEERELLPELLSNANMYGNYNQPSAGSSFNFKWIGSTISGSNRHIACATVFFISEIPSDGKVEGGEVRAREGDRYSKGEDYADFRLERAVLIGNAIIKAYGPDTNVVYSPNDQAWPLFPIQTYTPNMYMGTSRSVVDRMKKFQDDIDAYEYKIRELISKDLGKVYIVNGFKVGDADTEKNIITNLKKVGLHVTEGVDGEDPSMLDSKPMMEVIDMTNSQFVQNYIALIQQKSALMEEVINASKVSLGQNQRYIGYGSHQASMESNEAGMSAYVDGVLQFYTYFLQYILNKLKIMYADSEGAEAAEMVLGDSGIAFFENTTEFQIEEQMVKVAIEDIIDAKARERLMAYTQAMVQNAEVTGIDWEDILDLETARTFTELKRRLKRKLQKAKDEKQKQQMMAMQQQLAAEQKASQERQQQQGVSEQGKDRREMMKQETTMAGKVLDKIPMEEQGQPVQ